MKKRFYLCETAGSHVLCGETNAANLLILTVFLTNDASTPAGSIGDGFDPDAFRLA